jgi:hypothetical protein
MRTVTMRIGLESFQARLRQDLAPRSCDRLMDLLPYSGAVIHARWSGEALWSPLAAALPAHVLLAREGPGGALQPGEVLLYAGECSEPELLIVYGDSRFACKSGPLEGNRVLTIEDGLDRIAELGHEILWGGAATLSIEATP